MDRMKIWKCRRCGYRWVGKRRGSSTVETPVRCAKCQSPYWNRRTLTGGEGLMFLVRVDRGWAWVGQVGRRSAWLGPVREVSPAEALEKMKELLGPRTPSESLDYIDALVAEAERGV